MALYKHIASFYMTLLSGRLSYLDCGLLCIYDKLKSAKIHENKELHKNPLIISIPSLFFIVRTRDEFIGLAITYRRCNSNILCINRIYIFGHVYASKCLKMKNTLHETNNGSNLLPTLISAERLIFTRSLVIR